MIEVLSPWVVYFDSTTHWEGAGAKVVIVISKGNVYPYYFSLKNRCSKNIAEYQALILRLEIAMDIKQLQLRIYKN